MMRVLIGCERSGRVREAFRARGHDAWSNDIVPADDGSAFHITGDVREVMRDNWDLGIFFPPCTFITRSGDQHHSDEQVAEGAALFLDCLNAPIVRVAVENPRMCLRARNIVRVKPAQVVQPTMFGHAEYKATCLWLRRLGPLFATLDCSDIAARLPKRLSMRCFYMSPGPDRARLRSETFPGIAAAMAEQWG